MPLKWSHNSYAALCWNNHVIYFSRRGIRATKLERSLRAQLSEIIVYSPVSEWSTLQSKGATVGRRARALRKEGEEVVRGGMWETQSSVWDSLHGRTWALLCLIWGHLWLFDTGHHDRPFLALWFFYSYFLRDDACHKRKGCRRETRMAEMKEQIHRAVGRYIAPISLSDFIYSCFIASESEAHKRCYDVSYLAGGNQSSLSNPSNPWDQSSHALIHSTLPNCNPPDQRQKRIEL